MTAARRLFLALALLVAAGCSRDEPGPDVTASAPEPDAIVDTVPEPAASATTEAVTTETEPEPPASLPGEQIDFGPQPGDRVDVIGVPYDDVLNVRIGPGTEFDVIEQLLPDTIGVFATGVNRLREDSFWIEVDLGERTGWVSEAFLGYLGTPEAGRVAPGVGREDMTIEELGRAVAETFASVEPPSELVQISPVVDSTVVFDVVGLGDDAVKGVRVTIATIASAGGLRVSGIEHQPICGRGRTADGLCI